MTRTILIAIIAVLTCVVSGAIIYHCNNVIYVTHGFRAFFRRRDNRPVWVTSWSADAQGRTCTQICNSLPSYDFADRNQIKNKKRVWKCDAGAMLSSQPRRLQMVVQKLNELCQDNEEQYCLPDEWDVDGNVELDCAAPGTSIRVTAGGAKCTVRPPRCPNKSLPCEHLTEVDESGASYYYPICACIR